MENNENNVTINQAASNSTSEATLASEVQTPKSEPQKGGYNPNISNASVRPCPICGTDYTYVCPKCGFSPYVGRNNTKKNIFSKWWFWLIAVALTFALIIGAASCMISLVSNEGASASDYKTTPLCEVGDIEVNLIPKESYRDEYTIKLVVEVKNKGKEKVSFYPTKVKLDGEKGTAMCDFSSEDWGFGMAFDWESYYAEDESIIIKPENRNVVELSFETEYSYDEEESSRTENIEDLRDVKALEFNINIANPETLKVLDTTKVTFEPSQIKTEKKYYEYE